MRPHLLAWTAVLALRVAGTLLGLLAAASLGVALTSGAPGPWLASAACAVFLRIPTTILGGAAAARLDRRVAADVRASAIRHLWRLGPQAAPGHRVGDLLVTLVDSVDAATAYLSRYLVQLVTLILVVPVALLGVGTVDVLAAVVAAGGMVGCLLAQRAWQRVTGDRGREVWEAQRRYAARLADALEGMATLIDAGGAEAMRRRLFAAADGIRAATTRHLRVSLASYLLTTLAAGVAGAGAVALLAGAGRPAAGVVAAFVVLETFRTFTDLRSLWHEGFYGVMALRGVFALLDRSPVAQDLPGAGSGEIGAVPQIRFEEVRYAYSSEADERGSFVLDGVDLDIPAGATTALVGASGSGKSTLARLLQRHDDRYEGRILLDGVELRDLPLAALRSAVAVVDQEVFLFDVSVAENILLGRPCADAEALHRVVAAACLDDVAAEVPDGLDMAVGRRGGRLSGGQRQRVATARALLRDAPLLILDEATSSLDGLREARVAASLTELRRGRTTLVIAHRPATVMRADQVVVLGNGRVQAWGTPAALRANGDLDVVLGEAVGDAIDVPLGGPSPRIPPAEVVGGGSERPLPRLPARTLGGMAPGLRGMARSMRGHLRPFALAAASGVVDQVCEVAATALAFLLLARAAAGLAPSGPLLAGLVAVLLLRAVSAWAENHLSHVLSFEVSHDLRDRLFRAFAHVLPHGLGRRSVPQLTQVALGDCEKVEVFYAHTSIYLVSAIVTPVVLVAGLAAVQPVAAVVVLAGVVLGAALPALTRMAGARAAEAATDATGRLRDAAEAAVAGVREIVSLRLEAAVDADLAAAEDAHQAGRRRRLRITALEESLTAALVAATPLAMAGVLAARGADAATALILTGVATAVMGPVEVLLRVTRHTGDTRAAARRIGDVLTTPDPVDRSGRLPMPATTGIEVDGVCFSWAGSHTPTLTDVTASFPAGTTTALVGASGAGKSTLVAVLARHVRPERGTVALGDVPIERIDPEVYDLITIGQDVHLFHDSVRSNLTLGSTHAPADDRLWEALRRARVDDVVRCLDGGLDAVVGERGGRLSGGERQRLALARALLADPSVIVLDEAVSQVDTAGEAALHAALRRLGPRTVVMVAHRLSTILSADRIVVMESGRVVDQGEHHDLMSRCPQYRALVEPQLAAITPVTADKAAPPPTQRRHT